MCWVCVGRGDTPGRRSLVGEQASAIKVVYHSPRPQFLFVIDRLPSLRPLEAIGGNFPLSRPTNSSSCSAGTSLGVIGDGPWSLVVEGYSLGRGFHNGIRAHALELLDRGGGRSLVVWVTAAGMARVPVIARSIRAPRRRPHGRRALRAATRSSTRRAARSESSSARRLRIVCGSKSRTSLAGSVL